MLLSILEDKKDKNFTKFTKLSVLMFFPIWFISFFISELAIMAFYAKSKDKAIGRYDDTYIFYGQIP
jgi:hypothetical protein